jgi:purine nucleosidase
MAAPLLRPLETAQNVHGLDGLGDIGLPLNGRKPDQSHAVDSIRATIKRYPGEITLVALGPLTNVAMALLLDPSLGEMVKECVIMGGTIQGYGNVTAVAEYNIWADPEAAKIVFSSSLPITVVDWYISKTYASFTQPEIDTLRSIGTPLAQFCVDIQRAHAKFSREVAHTEGFVLADPIAMAIALDKSVATEIRRFFVTVDTESSLCRGQTVVDHSGTMQQAPNVAAVISASREQFLQILHNAVAN